MGYRFDYNIWYPRKMSQTSKTFLFACSLSGFIVICGLYMQIFMANHFLFSNATGPGLHCKGSCDSKPPLVSLTESRWFKVLASWGGVGCCCFCYFILFCLFVSDQTLVDKRKTWYSAQHHPNRARIKLFVIGVWVRSALGSCNQAVGLLLPSGLQSSLLCKRSIWEGESAFSGVQ